jgi:hypothetical protein
MRRPLLAIAGLAIVLLGLAAYISLPARTNKTDGVNGNGNANDRVNGNASGSGNGNVSAKASAKPPAPVAQKAPGNVVVKGGWGSKPSDFGRRRDPESNPEGPMAIAAGANGELAVVDQINRRVDRYKDGKLVATIPLGGDTVQDVALGTNGRTLLLDRLADKNVQVYDSNGKLLNELTLQGKGVPEGGGVTGVFADDDGIYVEREHAQVVRIADANGNADPDRPELIGRPSRDGRLLIAAAIGDRANGEIVVRGFDRRSGQPLFTQPIRVDEPILHIVMLDSDRQGNIYLAVDVGREAPQPPYPIVDEKIVIPRLSSTGAPRGAIEVPPFPSADESFRPITVADDGTIYVMTAAEGGLTVTRYTFN